MLTPIPTMKTSVLYFPAESFFDQKVTRSTNKIEQVCSKEIRNQLYKITSQNKKNDPYGVDDIKSMRILKEDASNPL